MAHGERPVTGTGMTRVGIIGWSHGGLIALLSVYDHPEVRIWRKVSAVPR